MKQRMTVSICGVLAATWPIAAASGQMVQLKTGEVLVAKVRDAHEDGLEVQRLDNGGVLQLTWDQLSTDSAARIKPLWNLSVDDEGEMMITAEAITYELAGGGREEVIGRVIAQDDSVITVRRNGTNYPIQRSRIKHRAPVEVPAMDVYTSEEFYNEKLTELAPGDESDKHIQLADVLMRVREYDRAGQHLEKAAELGDSRQRTALDDKIKKLELYKGARAEREHLDSIRVALSRKDFAKGVKLVEAFQLQYPNSKLRGEFQRTQQLFASARERFLLFKVAELWYRAAVSFAEKKAAESGLSYDAAKEYAEEGMGKDIRGWVQQKLGLEAAEIEDLWARRLEQKRQPAPQRYSFGIGSWTLGQPAIRKGTVVETQQEPAKKEGTQDMERMVERIRKAQERARNVAQRGAAGETGDTPEAWWEAASREEKMVWLRAYYAEFGGDLVVVNAHLEACVTCTGDGKLTWYAQSGQAQKSDCPTCHGTQFKRWIRAH